MDYLLHGEDEHSYTIGHPDGTAFQVAKEGISEGLHKKIRMLAGGTPDGALEADNASVEPGADSLEAITRDAEQTPPNPNEKYQGMFMNQADLERTLNPGQPEQFTQKDALDFALNQKKADQSAAADAALEYQNQVKHAQAMNAQRAQIGLDALSMPPGGPQVTPEPQAAPQAAPMPQEQPQGIPGSQPGMYGPYTDLVNKELGAYDQMGRANKAAAEAQAAAYAENIKQTQAAAQRFQEQTAAIQRDLDHTAQTIQNTNIDPNRVWHDSSVAGKISAGIGLILGGIGSGLTGQPNQAMQMMNGLMERDMEAQKLNLGKQQSLYSMNLQRYHNAEMADTATRLQLNAMLQGQLGKAAAMSGSQQAMAQATLMKTKTQIEMMPLVQRFAAMQMKQKATQGGLAPAEDNVLSLIDPQWAKTSVPVNDRVYAARTEKDAQELKDTEAHFTPIQNDLNTLKAMGPSAIYDPKLRKQAEQLMARLGMSLNEFAGYKRFTEVDEHTIMKQMNDPSSLRSLLEGNTATIGTLKYVQDRLDKERSERLQGYKGMNSLKTRTPGWQPSR